ncbi:MAG: GntP family permease [Planctomycetaceae bacterium]|nr:GntP family permease [Planctomycetaceae bacterium]
MCSGISALVGLSVGIVLILRKFDPAYSLMFSALLAGILGGAELTQTVNWMLEGVRDMAPAIVRILAAGVLAGALVKTGSAEKIADSIIRGLGERNVLLSLVLALFFLAMAGVFIDVAVITAAPIALAAAKRAELSQSAVLLAMIGGGKAGNVVSPNPNTISAAEQFHAELSSVMAANWLPALAGIGASFFLAWILERKYRRNVKGQGTESLETESLETESLKETAKVSQNAALPNIVSALLGPLTALGLLALRPLAGISVDPLIALPAGGVVCILTTGQLHRFRESLQYGISKMSGVAILLVGTGTLAGIIKNSTLKDMVLDFLTWTDLPEVTLAPLSGALMSAASASTTAGATIASMSFSEIIMAAGISAVAGAAMINAGATVLDHLPHGSFFHATAGAAQMPIGERLKLIPYETAVGFVLALVSLWANG